MKISNFKSFQYESDVINFNINFFNFYFRIQLVILSSLGKLGSLFFSSTFRIQSRLQFNTHKVQTSLESIACPLRRPAHPEGSLGRQTTGYRSW